MNPFSRFKKFIFDPTKELKARVFALLTTVALIVASLAVIGDIIYHENIVEIAALLTLLLLTPLTTYYGVVTGHVEGATRLVSIAVILILMPIIFIFGGGLEGGSIPWLVFSFLYVGLVLSGWWRTLFIFLLMVVVTVLFHLAYYRPDLIYPHSRELFFWDLFLAVLEVGFVCFIMTWFQNLLFLQENRRAREETRKVEDLNRAQNRFFSNMSHEIRTPINSILGLNEIILRQEDASEEIRRDAENIQGAGRMLLALINDILDFSRIEAGKMDIVPVNYNVASMLSEIVNMLWLRAEEKGLELKIEVDPSIPSELYGDEVRIRQILVNLLNNAVKYTAEGTVTLHIEKEELQEDRVLLMFSVIDTGMGIKQDALPYLFDAFRREDEEKNTRIEGTGLGLSIVKQLVDLMDGRITVNSVYTQGSTFIVSLWQKVSRSEAVGEIHLAENAGSAKAERYQAGFTAPDARILIVDDNDMNLEVERKLLAGTKAGIDIARSGAEALSRTNAVHYDMILMDHLMPEMDGIECLQRIRKQTGGYNNSVPIIVLTANAGTENRELYNNSGFDGYLVKPVTGQQLEEMLLAHLPENKIQKTESGDTALLRISTAGSYQRKVPVLIATNSTSELPVWLVKQHQIDVIPYSISVDGRVYYDYLEAGTDEVTRYLREGKELIPSAPTVEEYEDFFGRLLKKAHNVIYITASSGISSEYKKAMAAAKAYGNVRVYDSGMASGAIGLLVLYAQQLCARGVGSDKIIEELDRLKPRMRCSFITDGAYFMRHHTKRYKGLYNLFQIMNIHFFVKMVNGGYKVKRVVFGDHENSFERFTVQTLSRPERPDTDLILIVYVDLTEEEVNRVVKLIRKRYAFHTILKQKVSGVTALQCGFGSFGLIFIDGRGESIHLNEMLQRRNRETAEEAADNSGSTQEDASGKAPGETGENAGPYTMYEKAEEEQNPAEEKAWYEEIPEIDAKAALETCGGEDGLRMMLQMFYESIPEKSRELSDFFAAEDWENYTIRVHALKSSAKLIGAMQLSEKARKLEMAGKAKDIAYIRENQEQLLEELKEYTKILERAVEE